MPLPAKLSDKHLANRDARPPALTTVGLIGARGHTGRELLGLIHRHPRMELAFATSNTIAGDPIKSVASEMDTDLQFIETSTKVAIDHAADIYILALPNGESPHYVEVIDATRGDEAIIVDLSADHRFEDTWTYGLAELNAAQLKSATRIANPGCYATAMMLALSPLAPQLAATPHVFGVSGYSGAGATPSPRNDPEVLRDNLLPYQLAGHLHEREVSYQLGRPIRFAPHVAPFFRGITATVLAELSAPVNRADLVALFETLYADHPLIEILPDDTPLVRDAANRIQASIGGFTVDDADPRRVCVVATLDNLLKGAASQAIQNINLACGFDPMEGLRP